MLNECTNEHTKKFIVDKDRLMPILFDKYKAVGNLDGHYFLQDIIMAQAVNQAVPKEHYDIGSRVDGFITHILSAGIVEKIIMMDVRPLPFKVDKLDFIQTDATNLSNLEDDSI